MEFELHLHNVSFDDKNEVIEIDAGSETYWINGNDIMYCWIHKVEGRRRIGKMIGISLSYSYAK